MAPIAKEELTPLVKKLVAMNENLQEEIQRLKEQAQQMRDEIAVLKGEKAKPKFKSSKMDEYTNKDDGEGDQGEAAEKPKRAGAAKRSKTAQLQVHADCVITAKPQTASVARQCWHCARWRAGYQRWPTLPSTSTKLAQRVSSACQCCVLRRRSNNAALIGSNSVAIFCKPPARVPADMI